MAYYRNSDSNYYRPSSFGGFQYFPPVIKTLLISNVAAFAATLFFGLFRIGEYSIETFLLETFALFPLGKGFQLWQLITYMFMHGGPMHLLFNMIALWMFGIELENVWGSRKFLTYYLACGIGAGLSNLLIAPLFTVTGPTVGASGAIYGVLIAFGMMFPTRPIFLYFLLPIQAKYFVLMYIALELYAGVNGTSDGVAHFAHLGGAAIGFVYMLLDRRQSTIENFWTRTVGRMKSDQRVNEYSYQKKNVTDAKYHDVGNDSEAANQRQIDEILDKISQSGYKSLTEAEKKLLFDASKRMN
jgi:membrane associated rhomboid family serine protease